MTTTSRLQKARDAFNRAMSDLDTGRGEYPQARQAIMTDRNLTPEGKQRKVAELRKGFETRGRQRQEAAAEAMADYLVALDKTANPPAATGIEGAADRFEAVDARARVRSMLGRGVKPEDIISRAVELGDITSLDALKTEARWSNPGSDRRPSALVGRIDQARADVIGGERGDAIREGLTMDAQRQAWTDKITRASSELDGPTLHSAVADRMAGISTPVAPVANGTGPTEGEAA